MSMENWHAWNIAGNQRGLVEPHNAHAPCYAQPTLTTKPDHPPQRKRDPKITVVGVRVVCVACVREMGGPIQLVTGASRSFLERWRRKRQVLPNVKEKKGRIAYDLEM